MECSQTTLATAHSATPASNTTSEHGAWSMEPDLQHKAQHKCILEARWCKRDGHVVQRRNHQWEKQLTTGKTECSAEQKEKSTHKVQQQKQKQL